MENNSIKTKKVLNTQNMIKIALLSAIAFVLSLPLFTLRLPIFPNFLQLDVADIPAIIGAVVLGPIPAVWIMALKNLLDVAITGTISAGIGPFANFIIGTAFVLPMGHLYHRLKGGKKPFLISCAIGIITATTVAALFNVTVLIPAYSYVLNIDMDIIIGMGNAINSAITDLTTLVLFSIVPFNLLKFGLVSFAGFIIYITFKPVLAAISKK